MLQTSEPYDDRTRTFRITTPVSAPESTVESSLLWEKELARLDSILKTLPSDLDKITFLRTYSGELIDIGRADNQTNRLYQSVNFESFRLSEFYSLFKRDSIPAACGITSYFYIKLLQTFKFKAYQYSFGFKEKPYQRFIHSVALVEVNFRGTPRLVIQDPFLNLTYRNHAGEPIDFLEFLSIIKQKRYELIVIDPSSVTTFLLVPEPSLYYGHLNDACRKLMSQALQQDNESFKTKLPITRNYATLMQSPCDNFEKAFVDAMHKNGYKEPFIYAYTLRASEMVGDSDHQQVQHKIDSILR